MLTQMKKKKIQIKMSKNNSTEQRLFNSIDMNSLELFREMMSDRFKDHPDIENEEKE